MVRKRYKIYRYLIAAFIILFIAAAAVSAVLLNREENVEMCGMNIVLERCTFPSGGRQYEVSSYRVTLNSPARQATVITLSKDVTATTREVSAPGAWTVVVEALNSSGRVVGRGGIGRSS